MRKIKAELAFVGCHMPLIGLAAFLCALGGVLLWINGGSAWYLAVTMHNREPTASLSGMFAVWTVVYALDGALLAMLWLEECCMIAASGRIWAAFTMAAASYLLQLVWYALFFCTRLWWFSAVILAAAIVAGIEGILLNRRMMLVTLMTYFVILGAEIYYLCVSVKFAL